MCAPQQNKLSFGRYSGQPLELIVHSITKLYLHVSR